MESPLLMLFRLSFFANLSPAHMFFFKVKIFLFIYTQLFMCSGQVLDPTFQFSLLTSFLYVNLGTKGAQKLFKTLAPQLTVLGIPHFC